MRRGSELERILRLWRRKQGVGIGGSRGASIIGVPHDGETPLALVIKRPDSTLTTEELTPWANERLAKHQQITGVEFRDQRGSGLRS
jgi:hypothetical protein